MTIHREGRNMLLVLGASLFTLNTALLALLPQITGLHYAAWAVSAVLFLTVLQFFRSPKVHTQPDEKKVYAPADGKVVVIEETVEGEYFKAPRLQVSIFMSPINVHVNRSPVAGIVQYFKYHAGKYLVAWHPKSSTENERTTVVVKMANGTEILFRQIAGALAKRIKCYVNEGQALSQGAEFGFIKFGSRVDIFLPLGTDIKVALNQKTTAGKTVVAEFK